MEVQLDLNDPLVREMADLAHVPSEAWTDSGYVNVTCRSCRQGWPCLTRRQLRGRQKAEGGGS